MKNALIFLVLLIINISHSQSTVQKYNSLLNRYEYFDSAGKLIGYKSYNSLMQQWEYYEINSNKKKSDYGNYVSPIDLNLVQTTLQNKQERYNRNKQIVFIRLDEIRNKLYDHFQDPQKKKEALRRGTLLYNTINDISDNYDFSNTNKTNELISILNNFYFEIIEIIENTSFSEVQVNKINNSPPNRYIKKCVLRDNKETFLKEIPSYKANKIVNLTGKNIIYLIEKKIPQNVNYDKVYANGYYGYILGSDLDNCDVDNREKVPPPIKYLTKCNINPANESATLFSKDYKEILKIKRYDEVLLIEENFSGIYDKVWVNGHYGYVIGEFLNKSSLKN